MAGRRRKVLWTNSADLDLGRALNYLNERNPQAARGLVKSIMQRLELLQEQPQLGHVVVDRGPERQYHRLVCGQHGIYYRAGADRRRAAGRRAAAR